MGNSILTEILARKKEEIAGLKRRFSPNEIKRRAENTTPPRDFASALASAKLPRVIAEIKKASPSKGVISENFNPASIAKQYEKNGAAAISVLTDEKFFQGHISFLSAVKKAAALPVLRKDFLIDPCQIYESRMHGADSVLLIAAAMENGDHLSELLEISRSLGMEPLVEVHRKSEVDMALTAKSAVIGINNRDLNSFKTDISVSLRLAPAIGADKVIVSESGITSSNEMRLLSNKGVSAFLVGESLMKNSNPGEALSGIMREWTE